MPQQVPDPDPVDVELDQLLEDCLARPESEWPKALADAAQTHGHLAGRLGERLQALQQFGLLQNERSVGGYTLLRPLGSGSSGEVFLAHSLESQEHVAIKLLHPNLRMSDTALRRFQRERDLAARIEHPSVCRIHDFGTDEGVPYLVMDYIDGEDLRTFAANCDRDPATLLPILHQVALTLGLAHKVGLAHRDIKPSNILVRSDQSVVLLDFGLARDLESSDHSLTASEGILGSPAYLAPEAIEHNTALGFGSDLYALGVTMYECLTGALPFVGATQAALFHSALHDSTPDPRTRVQKLPVDLSTVVQVCMAKNPRHRYRAPETLAADLLAVQEGRPVSAHLPSYIAKACAWLRRNPRASIVGLILALSLVATYISYQSEQFLSEMFESESRTAADLARAFQSESMTATRAVEEAQELYLRNDRNEFATALHQAVARAHRHQVFEFPQASGTTALPSRCAYLPANKGIIALRGDGFLWASDFNHKARLEQAGVTHFAADETGIVFALATGQILRRDHEAKISTELATGKALGMQLVGEQVHVVYLDPQGAVQLQVGSGPPKEIRTGLTTNKLERAFLSADGKRVFLSSDNGSACVDLHGTQLALFKKSPIRLTSRSGDSCVIKTPRGFRWVRTDDQRSLGEITTRSNIKLAISPHPRHGATLAFSTTNRIIRLFHQDGSPGYTIPDEGRDVTQLRFNRRGDQLLVGYGDGVARLYDLAGRKLGTLDGHEQLVRCVALHPDLDRALTWSDDGRIRDFDLHPGVQHHIWGTESDIVVVDVAKSGSFFCLDQTGILKLWSAPSSKPKVIHRQVACACFVEDHIAFGTTKGQWFLTQDGRQLQQLFMDARDRRPTDVASDGTGLVTLEMVMEPSGSWEVRTWRNPVKERAPSTSFTLDKMSQHIDLHEESGQIACSGPLGTVQIYNLNGEVQGKAIKVHGNAIWSVKISPDGRSVLTASKDNTAALTSLETRRVTPLLPRHRGTVLGAACSRQGKLLASASVDSTIHIYGSDHKLLCELRGHRGQIRALQFSADGRYLISGGYEGEIRIWPMDRNDLLRAARQLALTTTAPK
jgi:serine/threonine protein kinase/WD40 repeat protein